MNKYYTPHLDEFHGGFKYERLTDSGWEEKTAAFISDNPGDIRVKILSVDDVLSKGFSLYGETPNKVYVLRKITDSLSNPRVITLTMTFAGDFPLISINIEEEEILNNMLIQNINELEFVLSRLML